MYYYRDGIHSVGPFTSEKLIELYNKGIITTQTLVRSQNSDAWFEYTRMMPPSTEGGLLSERIEPTFSVLTDTANVLPPSPAVEDTDPPVALASNWALSPVAPWRRYFARMFDITVFGLLAWVFIGFAWYSLAPQQAEEFFNHLNTALDTILTVFLGSLISGIVLGFVGTTPGKSIFGIRVKTLKGHSIGLANGVSRDLSIFVKGLGLGIPLVSLVTLILSFRRLTRKKIMSWDEGQYTVTYRRNSGVQIALNVVGIILYIILLILVVTLARM